MEKNAFCQQYDSARPYKEKGTRALFRALFCNTKKARQELA